MAKPDEVYFGWMHGKRFKLKVDSKVDLKYKKGDEVKVIMVSLMGDCGLTKNMQAEFGYDIRLMPYQLEPIEKIPADVCHLCHYRLESGDHDKCSPDRKCEKCQENTGPGDPVCPVCIWREFLEKQSK